MADGVEIAKAYISINPDVQASKFAAGGGVAGQAFSDRYTKEVRGAIQQLQDQLRHEKVIAEGLGRDLGQSVGRAVGQGIQQSTNGVSGMGRTMGRNVGSSTTQGFEEGSRGLGSRIAGAFSGLAAIGGVATTVGGTIASVMQSASEHVSRFARQIGITAFNMQLVGAAMTTYFTTPVVGAMALASKVGFEFAMSIDAARASFTALLPVGYNVEALIKRMSQTAIDSPVFDTAELIKFTQQMVAAGVEIDKTEKLSKALGNIFLTMGASTDGANSAMYALQQMMSKGKIAAQEMNLQWAQAIPGGLRVFDEVARKFGLKTHLELAEATQAGTVSMKDFLTKLIEVGNSEVYLKGAAAGATSLKAAWQGFKESLEARIGFGFDANRAAIMAALNDIRPLVFEIIDYFVLNLPKIIGYFGQFVQKVKELKDQFDGLSPEKQEMIVRIIQAILAAGPALLILGQLTSGLGAFIQILSLLMNPYALLGIGLVLMLAGIGVELTNLYKKSQDFRDGVDQFVKVIKIGWETEIKPALQSLWDTITTKLVPAFTNLIAAFGFDSWKEFGNWLGVTFVNFVLNSIETVEKWVEALAKVVQVFADIVQGVRDMKANLFGADVTLKQGEGAGQLAMSGIPFHQEGSLEPLIKSIRDLGKALDDAYNAFKKIFGTKGESDEWSEGTSSKFSLVGAAVGALVMNLQFLLAVFQMTIGGITSSLTQALGYMSALITIWSGVISGIFIMFTSTATVIWDTFFGWLRRTWDGLWDGIHTKFTEVSATLTGAINALKDGFVKAARALAQGVGDAFFSLYGAAAKPVQFIIGDVYNDGIVRFMNTIQGVIDLGIKLPKIDGLKGQDIGRFTPAFATGGQVLGPGTGTSDSILARLSNREFVVNAAATEQHLPLLHAINSGALPGFAGGGLVGGLAGVGNFVKDLGSKLVKGSILSVMQPAVDAIGGALRGAPQLGNGLFGKAMGGIGLKMFEALLSKVHAKDVPDISGTLGGGGRSVEKIIALAKASKLSYTVNSTDRPGANDYHGSGRAVDFGGNMSGLAGYFYKMGGALLELIHGPTRTGIKNGKPYDWGPALWAEHGGANEHVHVAMNGDAGAGTGGAAPAGQVGAWINAAIARTGVPANWAGPLYNLIMRESGGNPNAINLTDSNAMAGYPSRGLMQTIPQTFNTYRDLGLPNNIVDPLANIVAGIRYILARYGSIFNVQQAVGATPMGYDNGGPIGLGDTLVRNQSRKTETMLNHAQGEALRRRIEGDGKSVHVTVLLDGEPFAEMVEAKLDEQGNATIDTFRRGRRGK